MTTAEAPTPMVWIGSLHAYNSGKLIGEWVDATELDAMHDVVGRVLAKGGGEEIALFDFEGFGEMIGEYTPLDQVAEVATALETHGEPLIVYAAHTGWTSGDDLECLVEEFGDAYVGDAYDGLREYAAEVLHDLYDIPSRIAPYIDYHAFAEALEADGYWSEGRHVFRPV